MKQKKVLVLGGFGQLGQCIQKVATEYPTLEIECVDETRGHILDESGLILLFEEIHPDFVINCAAYTAVDKAEDEIDLCRTINANGAANVANCCETYGCDLVHISTDFVFEGNTPLALTELMETKPASIYGLTKLEGERLVQEQCKKSYIVRTSWLYSEFANNFMKTMLKLSSSRNELGVIVDQIGTPTYAVDLARVVLEILTQNLGTYGIYHYSNEGAVSWYDFAKAIFTLAKKDIKVHALKTAEYPTRAVRPAWSVLDKTSIKDTFSIKYHTGEIAWKLQ